MESRRHSAAAALRNCYCGSLSRAYLDGMGVPEGYCGICERCGEPGHTQHFPGPAPYTGAWCDRCVKVVQVLYWLKAILIFAVIALLLWSLVSLVW